MGSLIIRAQGERVICLIDIGKREGAGLVTGGDRATLQSFGRGFFVEPTLFGDVTDETTIAREEIFGLVTSVLDFATENEAIAHANAAGFGPAAGVFTAARAHRVVARLEVGTTWIDAYSLAPVEAPFGGVKSPGLGRENGLAAIKHHSGVKSVYAGLSPEEVPF